MLISELQDQSTENKLKWLQSIDGLSQLREWLSVGLSLHKIAPMLQIQSSTLYKFCDRTPEIVAITGRKQVIKVDLSRPPAYRIVTGYSYHSKHRGQIICEYETANELWQSDFICNYFWSFGKSCSNYFDIYLKEITSSGVCQLSNSYIAMFCEVNRRGIIKILKPTSR